MKRRFVTNHFQTLPNTFHGVTHFPGHTGNGYVAVHPHRAQSAVWKVGIAADIVDNRIRRQVFAMAIGKKLAQGKFGHDWLRFSEHFRTILNLVPSFLCHPLS